MFGRGGAPELGEFQLRLQQFVSITEPIARSIWSLESSHANASDVYVFWLACASHLKELFEKPAEDTGISRSLANSVINIFNDQFDEFFMPNEVYFTAFAMDPRMSSFYLPFSILIVGFLGYPISDVLLVVPTAQPTIMIPRPGADLSVKHPQAYDHVREYLKKQVLRVQTRSPPTFA